VEGSRRSIARRTATAMTLATTLFRSVHNRDAIGEPSGPRALPGSGLLLSLSGPSDGETRAIVPCREQPPCPTAQSAKPGGRTTGGERQFLGAPR
jgi:hypothetical protein